MKFTSLLAAALLGAAGQGVCATQELADLSLEELANVQVTSASKRTESLATAAASIFVLSGDDIRRSGAVTLPEALRLAPNLQVARLDARNYAITARGFNNPFENKLLVLIDGRTVYSPLFSGVFWDAQDVVLDDVDRIEVISGPGATLWGANAVNGVINITTKAASQTQGDLVTVTGGRDFRDLAVRHGGELASGGHFRMYGKFSQNENTLRASGLNQVDGWDRRQLGFRADWERDTQSVTVQGDAYHAMLGQAGTPDISVNGANLLARLKHKLAQDDELQLQAYLDHTGRDQPGAFRQQLETVDVEAQRQMVIAGRHRLVVGGGYRHALDRLQNGAAFGFLPERKNLNWANAFVEDSIAITPKLELTLGHKVEHNPFTGNEQLPSLRLAFRPTPQSFWWTSLSRAVRAPSRIDRDFHSPPRPPYVIAGGPDFRSEVAKVLEIGYRGQPTSTLYWSATAFYARYDSLRTLESAPGGAVFRNNARGDARGVEFNASWRITPAWRLMGGASVQRVESQVLPGVVDLSGASNLASNDPSSWWQVRSSWDVSPRQQLDLVLRHMGQLARPAVPAYTELDGRWAFKLSPELEVALIAQNLLAPSHREFAGAVTGSELPRQVMVKVTWRQ